jgi:hypothetical protein
VLFLLIRESRPNRILPKKVEQLKKKYAFEGISVGHIEHALDSRTFVRTSLLRPLHLFFTEPIVFAIIIMGATVYTSAYLLTELLPDIYSGFNFNLRQSGLVFLAIGLGAITFPVITRLYDSRIGNKRKQQGRELVPEDKLLGFFIAAPVQAIAL